MADVHPRPPVGRHREGIEPGVTAGERGDLEKDGVRHVEPLEHPGRDRADGGIDRPVGDDGPELGVALAEPTLLGVEVEIAWEPRLGQPAPGGAACDDEVPEGFEAVGSRETAGHAHDREWFVHGAKGSMRDSKFMSNARHVAVATNAVSAGEKRSFPADAADHRRDADPAITPSAERLPCGLPTKMWMVAAPRLGSAHPWQTVRVPQSLRAVSISSQYGFRAKTVKSWVPNRHQNPPGEGFLWHDSWLASPLGKVEESCTPPLRQPRKTRFPALWRLSST